MNWLANNMTKVLGAVVTVLGVLQTMITGGAFEGLMDPRSIRWLAIVTTLFGAAITGVGFNNSSREKVAAAMETALRATPPQQGFARPLLLTILIALSLPMVAALHGCGLVETMQPQGPLTLDQRISVAYDQYTAAVTSIGNNVREHRTTGADGQKALKAADDMRIALDMARGAPDVQTAEGQLALAANALREVQKYLDKRAAP
jgi:hypothetical protein